MRAALAVLLLILAALGVVEWLRGAVGPGIWLAVAVEMAFAVLLMRAR